MPRLKAEPTTLIRSLEELFAVAATMERSAIDGYRALAERMCREGRDELVAVFEGLVDEASGHLAKVEDLSQQLTGTPPDGAALRWDPQPNFDDEGAGSVAPELLSAYRAFSIAVRNEERSFAFWTYVAAQSETVHVQRAAEEMARTELEHVAALRHKRRRAFHADRAAGRESWTLAALEERLAALLETAAAEHEGFDKLARKARARASALVGEPLGDTPLLGHVQPQATTRLRPTAELLLEAYLDLGERLPSQAGRGRAQAHAADLLRCIAAAG